MDSEASPCDTFGEIKFVRRNSWPENEKPYILTYLPTDNFPLSNFDFGDVQNVPIKDMRPIKDELSLDGEGFVVADFASTLTYDEFFEEEKLRAVFADELRKFWKDRYGVKAVYIHECVIRKRGSSPGKGYGQPVQEAHTGMVVKQLCHESIFSMRTDYTIDYIRQLIPQLVGHNAVDILARRFQMVNLWKPLRGPLRDWPLAVCDYSSVSSIDMIRVDEVHKQDILESHGVQYSPSQKWYYLSDMKPSEMLIFKAADSHMEGAVPHSAFKDTRYESELPRESIELRVLLVW
ncbi:unnamed protein product [Alternaria alternata]